MLRNYVLMSRAARAELQPARVYSCCRIELL